MAIQEISRDKSYVISGEMLSAIYRFFDSEPMPHNISDPILIGIRNHVVEFGGDKRQAAPPPEPQKMVDEAGNPIASP